MYTLPSPPPPPTSSSPSSFPLPFPSFSSFSPSISSPHLPLFPSFPLPPYWVSVQPLVSIPLSDLILALLIVVYFSKFLSRGLPVATPSSRDHGPRLGIPVAVIMMIQVSWCVMVWGCDLWERMSEGWGRRTSTFMNASMQLLCWLDTILEQPFHL